MLRVFLTIVLPLLLPTALYLVWVTTLRRPQPNGGGTRGRRCRGCGSPARA